MSLTSIEWALVRREKIEAVKVVMHVHRRVWRLSVPRNPRNSLCSLCGVSESRREGTRASSRRTYQIKYGAFYATNISSNCTWYWHHSGSCYSTRGSMLYISRRSLILLHRCSATLLGRRKFCFAIARNLVQWGKDIIILTTLLVQNNFLIRASKHSGNCNDRFLTSILIGRVRVTF